jgi:dimethylhistidine N-methyltransferase
VYIHKSVIKAYLVSMITQNNPKERLQIENLLLTHPLSYTQHGNDVIKGLTQFSKVLPPHYLYDDYGSHLFEQICDLPEYYPTRTEASILAKIAPVIAEITGVCDCIELGSGSSTKTRLLLSAYEELGYGIRYVPIDVSPVILEVSAQALLKEFAHLTIHGLVSTYELALQELPVSSLPTRIVVFLGSTLGNFTPEQCEQLFTQIYQALDPGDYFLLGVDLQKDIGVLEAAYNDSQGITAQFNLNMLRHLNWRFQGDFDLAQFQHQAFYNETESRIEMHLLSQCSQVVHLKKLALAVNFADQETILTEISRKFNLATMAANLEKHHLQPLHSWTDPQQWFGVMLCQKIAP